MSLSPKSKSPWIVSRPNPAAAFRLFCCPYAGGSAAVFQKWQSRFGKNIEIYGLQLPGRGSRISEKPYLRFPAMISAVGATLVPLLDRPFAFFGHSLGAILAFELSRWLRENHKPLPAMLIASAHRAPQVSCTRPPLHRKSDSDFITGLLELKGIPDEVLSHNELLALVLPTLRADCELDETYQYVAGEPLNCPIAVVAGADDQSVDGSPEDWKMHTSNSFACHTVSGGHFFIHEHEDELITVLRRELDKLSVYCPSPSIC